MKITILITTYNRPAMLKNLLADILKYKDSHDISVIVINDKSTESYRPVCDVLKNLNDIKLCYSESNTHFGKPQYWRLIDFLFKSVQRADFDYVIQIPDDIRLTEDFFNEAIRLWNSIADKRKACLNLLNDYGRDGKNIWTKVEVKDLGEYYETGWVDMCYIADKCMFDALNYDIEPVSRTWTKSDNHSSGVGMQLSIRLNDARLKMYQVKRSLVIHGAHESVMHPDHRQNVPLITNHISDKITATMASMPERMNALEESVASLLPQVDELQIYLNGFEFIPEFLQNEKILLIKSQAAFGDLGDAGKFYNASRINGYHFTVDDDILYPPDYCLKMIETIEKYNRKSVITVHGRRWKTMPVDSYYHNNADVCQCTRGQLKDMCIHIPGTGVMGYHTDLIHFKIEMFRTINMADIWAAITLQAKGVPVISRKHDDGWIRLSRKVDESRTIYSALNKSDKFQTDVVNAVDWKLNTVL